MLGAPVLPGRLAWPILQSMRPFLLGDVMNRRHFLSVVCLGAVAGTMANAASYEDTVVAQLRAQGYKQIKVERTLLGRVKISAALDGGRREIILNPRTGEVLRVLWIAAEGGASVSSIVKSNTGTTGSGTTGGGTAGDDNGEDDDSADDNSGNGGGNSEDNDSENEDSEDNKSEDGDDSNED